MYYYNKNTKQRLAQSELDALNIDMENGGMEAAGIGSLSVEYPENYDSEIHDISEDPNESVVYYEEEREISMSPFDFPGMDFMQQAAPQITKITVKGYRINWVLTAKDKDIVKPIILARLTAKKHAVEDAGVTLPDGTVIQSTEADRSRIAQLMISLVYLKVFNPSDVEFKQYMDELKFKVVDGVFRPISETEILYFFKVMAIRTLSCFERENVITGLIETAYTAGDKDAMLAAYIDNIDTGWPA